MAHLWTILLPALARLIGTASGLECLSCSKVGHVLDCRTIQQCGSHEYCYASQFVDSNGFIYWELGCKDTLRCSSGSLVGKRVSGDVLVCDQCCNTSLCQETLCGGTKLVVRGPMCYACDYQLHQSGCNTVDICGRDEVCITTLGNTVGYQTGCFSKLGCAHLESYHNSLQHAKRGQTCLTCCSSDLCNVNCTVPFEV